MVREGKTLFSDKSFFTSKLRWWFPSLRPFLSSK
nr:MAG TPA: hypothetical protein [Caudoviricetes sp.]